MDENERRTRLLGFGRFRFDAATGELWRDGHAIRLAPKPAQLLRLLLEAGGDLVPRETLEVEIWGNQPIDLQRSLNFAIRQVRSALGDSADAPVYIETLPRRGYRFIAPVTAHPLSESGHRLAAPRPSTERAGAPPPRRAGRAGSLRRSDRFTWAVLGTAAALLAAAGVALARAEMAEPEDGDETTTLAVLPLERLVDDARHDYFLAGLTDEIITRLARLDPERLTVIAPTSARRAAKGGRSDEEIASALAVRYLLRGSITPTVDGVRVGVRLIDPSDGSVIWAERYVEPIPTSPALEYEIATRVAEALRQRLPLREGPTEPVRAVSREARIAFLQGSYLLDRRDGRTGAAIDLLHRAVRSDSTHAPSRSALARALWRQGRSDEGRAHLEAAIELDPRLTEARVGLGIDALYRRWDLEGARRHFEQALASDPGNVLSHHPYAYYLSIVGRHEDAVSEIETALALDPISPLVNGDVGRIYYRAARFDEARAQCHRTLQLLENDASALSCLVDIHLRAGDTEGALPYAIRSLGESDEMIAVAGRLRSQDPERAIEEYFDVRLGVLEARRADGQDVAVPIAQALIRLGRVDEALDALEAALEARSSALPRVPGDPGFALLHGNPRFDAIIDSMGIPR